MNRGDIFLAAMPGDYGKPRPVIVVQAQMAHSLVSQVVCPLTTFDEPAAWLRPAIEASADNGLADRSFVMVEKIGAVPLHRFHQQIGRADAETMARLDRSLTLLLGLA